jgi:hypothetical protein
MGRAASLVRTMISSQIPASHAKNLIILVITFAALTVWSWRKWSDPVVDFGRELYQPWQISVGKVLYRDIAVLFGPFSQYLNALWFTLFGVSVTTLIVCNLVILAALVACIYYLFASACGASTALVTAVAMLVLFGFSQYVSPGNYNFVCPYSHEATHGTALAVAAMVCLYRGARDSRRRWFALAGFCYGLVLLTKAEVALAITAAAAAGLAGAHTLDRPSTKAVRAGLWLFVGAAGLPILLFLLYFWAHMPLREAVRAVGGSWTVMLTSGVTEGAFYRRGMGIDAPLENTLKMLKMFAEFLLFVGVLAAIDARWPRLVPRSRAVSIGRRIGRLAVLFASVFFVPWAQFPRALPLVALACVVVFSLMFVRVRSDRAAAVSRLPMVMWSVFGFVLLGKMVLNARIYHYGFYLAMPATLLLVAVVVWLVPGWLGTGGGQGEIFRAVATLVLLGGVAVHLGVSHGFYRLKDFTIGSGGDTLVTFGPKVRWQEAAVSDALRRLRATPRKSTLAVVPEGVIINYLARRENPTPYINLMPPEIGAFGEVAVLDAFASTPPDYIILLHKDMAEYGVGVFGTDARYGLRLMKWIRGHYITAEVHDHAPLTEGGGRVEILKVADAQARALSAPPAQTQRKSGEGQSDRTTIPRRRP